MGAPGRSLARQARVQVGVSKKATSGVGAQLTIFRLVYTYLQAARALYGSDGSYLCRIIKPLMKLKPRTLSSQTNQENYDGKSTRGANRPNDVH